MSAGDGVWRAACDGDEPFLREVFDRTHGAQFAALPPSMAQTLCEQQYRLQLNRYRGASPGMQVLVLHHDGQDVGRLLLHDEPDALCVMDLAVLPAFQRRGIASRALVTLQRESAGRPVRLTVARHNTGAVALYEGLGFVCIEQLDLHHRMEWRA